MSKKSVLVIGGGAAGMMSAIFAAENGAAVTLLEPNERLGKKLNITGKGRCNVTNNAPMEELLQNTPRNGKFLYSAFSHFDGRDAMAFFERLGVPLKTERGNRVFPVSDRSFDISAALERRLKSLHVRLVRAQAVILATGGVSYPATGSTGEGHRMAASVGHTITPLQGSLVPLREQGNTCAAMQGLSLRNVTLTAFENDKKVFRELGELVFTHFGVSGPLALSASAHMRRFDKKRYHLEIDLKPGLDEAQLDRRLLSDFEKYCNHDFCNALNDLLPQKMIPQMVAASGIDPHCKVNAVTREQRKELIRLFKHWPIPIAGLRPVTDAIITSGGVKVSEVNPTTMESKVVKGLYFAGEILDVDAYTGGFNLQIAWATGRAAGIAASSGEN